MLENETFILICPNVPTCPPPPPTLCLEQHTSIQFKQPQFGLWNWKTLKDFKEINRIWKSYQNFRITPSNIGKWDFDSTIIQGSKHPRPKRHTSISFIQPWFGLWNKEKLMVFEWKKFIESEKNWQNIRNTLLAILSNGLSILPY